VQNLDLMIKSVRGFIEMTILTLNRKEFEKSVGKVTKELEDRITQMGTPVEEVTKDEFSVEVFPNRPDLLSLTNFANAVNQFNGKKGVAKYNIKNPEKNYTVTIDKSVKKVRPHTVCVIVKNLKLDDEKIVQLIDVQEKLHNSLGRKRKKVAIGIYPLDKISLPITFTAKKPEDIMFRPLESEKDMSAKQILKQHPAGVEYADLLKDKEVYPLFVDANDEILSMPPIINSEKTGRVNEKTKEVFIECSGDNLHYLKKCLNILVQTFCGMGATIYSMNIKDSSAKSFVSPDMSFEELPFKVADIEKTLGIKLDEKTVKNYLGRMGIGYLSKKGESIALIPPYRADILHWIDLSEEIAIAYGYENFEPIIPEISTIAEEDKVEKMKRVISNILAGVGLLETSSFHLTTKKNIKKSHFDYKDFIEVAESKTAHDTLRVDLLTNLFEILSENSDAGYPQKIFEMGRVFSLDKDGKTETGIEERENLAIAMIDEKMNFTELKQVVDYLFKMLDVEYTIEETEDSNYIAGRVGNIVVDKKKIGVIGEVSPRVIKNWKLKTAVVSLEIYLDKF
jgi:phenylalanyl-tRNA synthetase beta chain